MNNQNIQDDIKLIKHFDRRTDPVISIEIAKRVVKYLEDIDEERTEAMNALKRLGKALKKPEGEGLLKHSEDLMDKYGGMSNQNSNLREALAMYLTKLMSIRRAFAKSYAQTEHDLWVRGLEEAISKSAEEAYPFIVSPAVEFQESDCAETMIDAKVGVCHVHGQIIFKCEIDALRKKLSETYMKVDKSREDSIEFLRRAEEAERNVGDKACLQVFASKDDAGEGSGLLLCGLEKKHDGGHAWRGDLPGGPLPKEAIQRALIKAKEEGRESSSQENTRLKRDVLKWRTEATKWRNQIGIDDAKNAAEVKESEARGMEKAAELIEAHRKLYDKDGQILEEIREQAKTLRSDALPIMADSFEELLRDPKTIYEKTFRSARIVLHLAHGLNDGSPGAIELHREACAMITSLEHLANIQEAKRLCFWMDNLKFGPIHSGFGGDLSKCGCQGGLP